MDQGKGKKNNYVPFETFIKRRIKQEAEAKRSVTKFVELRANPLERYKKPSRINISPEAVVAGFFVVVMLVLAMLLAGAT